MINTYGVVIHALEINFDRGFLTECFIYLSMAICSLKRKKYRLQRSWAMKRKNTKALNYLIEYESAAKLFQVKL